MNTPAHAITPTAGMQEGGRVDTNAGFTEGGFTARGAAMRAVHVGCIDSLPGRPVRPAADHPANVASRERSMRAVDLAFYFANEAVRWTIERPKALVVVDEVCWSDTRPSCIGYHKDIEKALQYIGLREPDALPYRFIRHPEQPHLVRFEDKP